MEKRLVPEQGGLRWGGVGGQFCGGVGLEILRRGGRVSSCPGKEKGSPFFPQEGVVSPRRKTEDSFSGGGKVLRKILTNSFATARKGVVFAGEVRLTKRGKSSLVVPIREKKNKEKKRLQKKRKKLDMPVWGRKRSA